MNLGTLLQTAGDLCDNSPNQSPTALATHKRFANAAISELVSKAPYMFRSDERRYNVPQSLSPLSGETMEIDSDAWVLHLDTTDATAIAQWRLDGTHATQAIYLRGASGAKVKRIIQGVALIGGEIYVSITQPWHNTTDTGLTWEVVTEDFYLPKDLKSIEAVRLTDASSSWYRDIQLIGDNEGRKNLTGTINRVGSSNPWQAYPGGDIHIPTPAAPTAALSADASAFASYPVSTFEYTLTLAWGSRPEGMPRPAQAASTSARLTPLIESEPSQPVTATPVASTSKVVLTLPDIAMHVASSTGTRSNPDLVGYYLCVYRAVEGEQPKLWRTVPAGTTTVDDDGSYIPDYFRPLPRDGGARSLTFDAIPADAIIVDGVWVPPRVVHDSDSLMVDDTGGRALVELTAERIHLKLNNTQAAAGARVRFLAIIPDMADEQGSGQDPARPRRRATRRIGGGSHGGFYPRHSVDYDWGS